MRRLYIIYLTSFFRLLIDLGIFRGFFILFLVLFSCWGLLKVSLEYSDWIGLIYVFSILLTVQKVRKDRLFLYYSISKFRLFLFVDYLLLGSILGFICFTKWYFWLLLPIFCLLVSYIKPYNFTLKNTLKIPLSSEIFEWLSGLRQIIVFYILAVILFITGTILVNYYILITAIGIMFFQLSSFYSVLESQNFITCYWTKPKAFLIKKITLLLKHILFFVFPFFVMILFLEPEKSYLSIGIFFIGILLNLSLILAKYAFYPHKMSVYIIQYLISGLWLLSFFSPFTIIILIFLVFSILKKSLKNLQNYLYD